jgi:hypothetical protein
MKTVNTYKNIQPTATGICPAYRWEGYGCVNSKGIDELS